MKEACACFSFSSHFLLPLAIEIKEELSRGNGRELDSTPTIACRGNNSFFCGKKLELRTELEIYIYIYIYMVYL